MVNPASGSLSRLDVKAPPYYPTGERFPTSSSQQVSVSALSPAAAAEASQKKFEGFISEIDRYVRQGNSGGLGTLNFRDLDRQLQGKAKELIERAYIEVFLRTGKPNEVCQSRDILLSKGVLVNVKTQLFFDVAEFLLNPNQVNLGKIESDFLLLSELEKDSVLEYVKTCRFFCPDRLVYVRDLCSFLVNQNEKSLNTTTPKYYDPNDKYVWVTQYLLMLMKLHRFADVVKICDEELNKKEIEPTGELYEWVLFCSRFFAELEKKYNRKDVIRVFNVFFAHSTVVQDNKIYTKKMPSLSEFQISLVSL